MGAHQKELVLSSTDMVGGSPITSESISTRGAVKASFQSVWSGTPTGTISLEGSNHRLAGADPSNARVKWTPLTVAAAGIHGAQPAGSASSQIQIVTYMPRYIRLRYVTGGAGAGTLEVQLDLDDVAD